MFIMKFFSIFQLCHVQVKKGDEFSRLSILQAMEISWAVAGNKAILDLKPKTREALFHYIAK